MSLEGLSVTVNEVMNEVARRDLLEFTVKTMPTFKPDVYHDVYYRILTEFAKGNIKKLIITMPPQHGKSEGSTRRLPSFILGRNPNVKIAVASYSTPFARKFNRDVQRIIDTHEFVALFPKTTLNGSNVVTRSDNSLRNADEFEVVGYRGGLKAVGRGGALTGNAVDVMIMDDLYKDYSEGNSPVVRENVWDWYTTVVKTRLHNDSQELIVFTRWNEDDLIGRLEKKEQVITLESLDQIESIPQNAWVKINFEAIKTTPKTELDKREVGEPLWGAKHDLNKLNQTRDLDTEHFECLYQGNPKSKEGQLYTQFSTYDALPSLKIVKCYVDTADTGQDYLCGIVYGVGFDKKYYVLDVLYTQEPMELTEKYVPEMLIRNKVNLCDIESNNGGRGFARVVDKSTPNNIQINWFHQSGNKESRIFSNSALVQNNILLPKGWHNRFPLFFDHVMSYKKSFAANKHDDAADCLTGVIEKNVSLNEFFVV